jgi:hypothetical protein
MNHCRLSVNVSGAFMHPLGDQTPIDCRYGEDLATEALPDKALIVVREKTVVGWGRVKHPRGLEIKNVSNQTTQKMPEEDELEAMRRSILYVGFGDSDTPVLELPPFVPGGTQFGGAQFLWLAPGAVVWLSTTPGALTTARVQIFPGGEDGKDNSNA